MSLINLSKRYFLRFQLIFIMLFIIFMLLTIHLTRNYALSITSDTFGVFYWLSPTLSIIQTGNLILAWGGILSCIAGVFIPTKHKEFDLNQLLSTVFLLAIFNFEFLLASILSTFTYEKLFIDFQVNPNFNVFQNSFKIFSATYLFLLFWSLIGYGLKLSFRFKSLSIFIGVFVQITEHYFIILYKPAIEKYLPFALSRQLVISQFPFWTPGSWAAVPGTIKYASTPMIVDAKYNLLVVSPWWEFAFLFWYLSIVYVIPTIKISNKLEIGG